MEDLPDNIYETKLQLHKTEERNSDVCDKFYTISFINEDKNNFKIRASSTEGDENFIYHFRFSDYVNQIDKDFCHKINNFNLLFETFKTADEENAIIIYKPYYDTLMIAFYYTVIYEKKKLIFELHNELSEEEEKDLIGMYYKDSEKIDEENNRDYKAEIISFHREFEDYGDRNIVRLVIENKGTCTWETRRASLICVPEFSTLLCKEYIFERDVLPGEQVNVELEYLKNEEENLEPPFFTFLHLNIDFINFEPMLVLDFDNTFKSKKTQKIQDIKNENKNEIREENKNEIKSKNMNEIKKENKNEIKNRNKNEIKEENKNEIKEENKNEIKGENKNKIKDNKNEIKDYKNEIKEENKNEIKENNKIYEKEIKKADKFPQKEKTEIKKEDGKNININKGKELTPFQKRIQELNRKEKERKQKEEENKKLRPWERKLKK